jgi:phosphoribosylaminoimidazole-succinocarboxamide synthase
MATADRFLRAGKVRDLYDLPDGRLLLVASDRISAFDVVLPTEIPDKGRVLTGLSRFWFAETSEIVPNHLLDTDPSILAEVDSRGPEPTDEATVAQSMDTLRGRSMICRPARVIPIEAVVRGYLAGSGWKEYAATGRICGVPLPPGLRDGDRLPEPTFTPATKAEAGEHDENIDFDTMVEHLALHTGLPVEHAGVLGEVLRDKAIALYRYAAAILALKGILLADTKFEFGFGVPLDELGIDRRSPRSPRIPPPADVMLQRFVDSLILIDEALTPDSSRFWDTATYEPGHAQASFDKQFVRDWLEHQAWDKTAPGPALPEDVVDGTRGRYIEAFERITGASFERYLAEDVIAR